MTPRGPESQIFRQHGFGGCFASADALPPPPFTDKPPLGVACSLAPAAECPVAVVVVPFAEAIYW